MRSCAAVAGPLRCSPRGGPPMPECRAAVPVRAGPEVAELLAGITERTVLAGAPGKSGARLERVMIAGQPYVLKHLDPGADWTLRSSGCLRAASQTLWERGILHRLPDLIRQPIVGIAVDKRAEAVSWECCTLVMHDVGQWLV